MTAEGLRLIMSTLVLFTSAMVYIAPLRKRQGWQYWLVPMFALFAVILSGSFHLRGAAWFLNQSILALAVVLLMNRCTKMSLAADLYCSVWIQVTAALIIELWLGLLVWKGWLEEQGMFLLSLAVFSAVAYLLLYKTIAQWMPQGDLYQIGPRQLCSALLLGSLSMGISYYFLVPHQLQTGQALIYLLIQGYCVTVLYLQTELFKKSRMEQDLEVMHYLYGYEQQQYLMAVQTVKTLEAKSQELEAVMAKLPQEVCEANRELVDQCNEVCDGILRMRTDNNVLDIVLMEKTMLAQLHHIQINCVADGKLLDFMDVVDVYAIFSNALDNAIEAVQAIEDENHRLIDVLIHESQSFLVINITNPIASSLRFEEGLPVTTKRRGKFHGYGLKVLRYAVEHYDGMLTVETEGGWFTLKVLIPMRKK